MKATLCERLRAPKAWMAWNDYGAVTIAGDPIPAMDHDSQAPREAADALDARDKRIAELEGALREAGNALNELHCAYLNGAKSERAFTKYGAIAERAKDACFEALKRRPPRKMRSAHQSSYIQRSAKENAPDSIRGKPLMTASASPSAQPTRKA